MRALFEYDLVRCQREAYPRLLPLADLSANLELAGEIVNLVHPFFSFYRSHWPIYSGFARRAVREDGAKPLLYAQLWEGGRVIRSVAFRGTGYVGVLHLDHPHTDGSYGYVDLIGAVFDGLVQHGSWVSRDLAIDSLALVEGNRLAVPLPWRP